jgi:Family of unknown function (DUF6526)
MGNMPQTYANHVRRDPLFHFFLMPVAALTICFTVYNVIRSFSWVHLWFVVLAVAFAVAILKMRMYALKAQDRVIRLEERMRLSTLCSEPLRSRIPELTESQLIALRFAADTECPALVEKALAAKMAAREIKKDIQNWRPDYFRI